MRESGSGSPPHVLVADDDPLATGALAWLLREHGYQVTSVSERRRLIEALERTRPDLLLVDVENIGPEGEQLLERVKKSPIVDSVFPFDQLIPAFEHLAKGPMGKVLIRINS